jgi:hypothetical protein
VIDVGRDFERMRDYLVGRLSDDERRTFEEQLVSDPQLAGELEQSLRLREGLQLLRARGRLPTASSRRMSVRVWLPALVAAAGAGLALFLWVHRGTHASPILMASLESHAAAAAEPLIAAHFTFVSMRGSSTPALQLPVAGLIEFRAAPASRTTVSRYGVTLLREDAGGSSQLVGAVVGLTLGTDGYVHCYADASRLAEGSYVLRITSDTDTAGTAETFPFTFRNSAESPP